MPPLTAQSLEYGRDQLPFLAFGGTEKPRNYVAEYMKGGKAEHFDVNNAYGNNAKGEYKFKYGLVWDGEPEIYDSKHREQDSQMMNMTLAPSEKAKESQTGAIIMKEGREMCTPGYVMQDGVCVLEPSVAVCQPGWRKVNGVCVKNPREFEHGDMPQGSMGTAPAATEYPMSRPSVLSMNRLRAYVQEKETGTSLPMDGYYPLLFLFLVMFVAYMGCKAAQM